LLIRARARSRPQPDQPGRIQLGLPSTIENVDVDTLVDRSTRAPGSLSTFNAVTIAWDLSFVIDVQKESGFGWSAPKSSVAVFVQVVAPSTQRPNVVRSGLSVV